MTERTEHRHLQLDHLVARRRRLIFHLSAKPILLVRELVRQISTNPKVVPWLATDNLIRNFTVVIANVADGPTPAKHLQVLRPSSSFQTIGRGGEL